MPSALKQFFRRHRIAAIVLAILAIYGCEPHARRQLMATPASLGDQGAYLDYAQLLLALAMIDVVYNAARVFG
jgi:hypothetical protein